VRNFGSQFTRRLSRYSSPSRYSRTNTSRTASDRPSSMVKRSRGQSSDAPSRRNCRVMVPPDSAFQSQTRRMKASRPMARRSGCFCSASSRSTTICVAMPAWSVPGCHSASRPCMRRQRISTSWSVLSSAWPICRLPVTLGGGIMMVKGLAGDAGFAEKAPALSQPWYRRCSIAAGSKDLSSMAASLPRPGVLRQGRRTSPRPERGRFRSGRGRPRARSRRAPGVRRCPAGAGRARISAAGGVPPAPHPRSTGRRA